MVRVRRENRFIVVLVPQRTYANAFPVLMHVSIKVL